MLSPLARPSSKKDSETAHHPQPTMSDGPLYLGFDLSTQQLKGVFYRFHTDNRS